MPPVPLLVYQENQIPSHPAPLYVPRKILNRNQTFPKTVLDYTQQKQHTREELYGTVEKEIL